MGAPTTLAPAKLAANPCLKMIDALDRVLGWSRVGVGGPFSECCSLRKSLLGALVTFCLASCGGNDADSMTPPTAGGDASVTDGVLDATGRMINTAPVDSNAIDPAAVPYLTDATRLNEPIFRAPVEIVRTGVSQSLNQADVNGDGTLDLVVVSALPRLDTQDPTTYVLTPSFGNGAGGFLPETTIAESPLAIRFKLADFNRDARPDILLSQGSDSLRLLLSDLKGGFDSPVAIAIGDELSGFLAGNLDGGGNVDIVTSHAFRSYVGVLLGNGASEFRVGAFTKILEGSVVVLADIDGDRKLDLVARTNPQFDRPQINRVAVLRGDGRLDVVMPGFVPNAPVPLFLDDQILIALGDGSGKYWRPMTISIQKRAAFPAIALSDINGDGKLDFVSASTCWDDPNRTTPITVVLAE